MTLIINALTYDHRNVGHGIELCNACCLHSIVFWARDLLLVKRLFVCTLLIFNMIK